MSNPYSVVQTDGQIYRDAHGEIFKDTKGRNWRIQRLDDGRRVFWNGTNWIDVQTLQPISRTRQPQAAPQHAPQQHAAPNQQSQKELAVLREHHANLAKSMRHLEHHVHNHDATTDAYMKALGEGILEIEGNLRKLQNHVNAMAAQAEKWINSTGRNFKN